MNASGQGTAAGSFEPVRAVALTKTEDAQTGTKSLLGVLARGKEGIDELGGMGTHGLSPTQDAFRSPVCIFLVSRRHMVRNGRVTAAGMGTQMGGHTAVLERNLDGMLGGPDIDLLANERVRDTVVMLVELDMVVNVDPGLLPHGEFIRGCRQGLEGRLVQ